MDTKKQTKAKTLAKQGLQIKQYFCLGRSSGIP
jgi:hypothetical protein